MFIVLEIQTNTNGTVSMLPPIVKASREEAESAYHSILSFAAVSALPMHAATLLANDGHEIMHQAYTHNIPEEAEE